VIEPNSLVARPYEGVRNRFRLCVTDGNVRQNRFVDPTLMLLELRHVRVPEHGEPFRSKPQALFDRVDAGLDRLMRRSVDQIEIDTTDTSGT